MTVMFVFLAFCFHCVICYFVGIYFETKFLCFRGHALTFFRTRTKLVSESKDDKRIYSEFFLNFVVNCWILLVPFLIFHKMEGIKNQIITKKTDKL